MGITFKQILSKTLMFVLILAVILSCQSIFGAKNILVSVGIVTQVLVLLGTNLSSQPFKNVFKVISINFLLCLCAFIVPLNPWVGLIINFAAVFLTVYLLMHDLTTPLYFSFLLTYLFMLFFNPITASDLPMRLALLASGGVAAIILQLLFNKNKSAKISNSVFSEIAQILISKIEYTLSSDSSEDTNEQGSIGTQIRALSSAIHERKKNSFFASPAAMSKLNIAFSLERIGLIIDENCEKKNALDPIFLEALDDIVNILSNFNTLIATKKSNSQEKSVLIKSIDDFTHKYQTDTNSSFSVYELIEVLSILKSQTLELYSIRQGSFGKKAQKDGTSKPKKHAGHGYSNIPREFDIFQKLSANLSPDSIRFSFAFRMAIAIAFSTFFIDLLNLEFGRWLVFTLFTLIQPYGEETKAKFKNRVKGTILGLILFIILFSIFQTPIQRSLIMMLAGYLSTYTKNYASLLVCITISALGAAAMSDSSSAFFEIDRVFYLALGGIIAILLNKFVFRCTLEGTTSQMQTRYGFTLQKLFEEIIAPSNEYMKKNRTINLMLGANLLEERLDFNNTLLKSAALDSYIENQRLLLNDISFLIALLAENNMLKFEDSCIFDDFIQIMNPNCSSSVFSDKAKKIEEEIYERFPSSKDINEKLVLATLYDILKELKCSYSFYAQAPSKTFYEA